MVYTGLHRHNTVEMSLTLRLELDYCPPDVFFVLRSKSARIKFIFVSRRTFLYDVTLI